MSFFKKLTSEFDNLRMDREKKKAEEAAQEQHGGDGTRAFGNEGGYGGHSESYSQGDHGQGYGYGHNPNPGYGQDRSYGGGHSDPNSQAYGYGASPDAPPPSEYQATPGPPYLPPQDKAPIPRGWIPLFDQKSQRWYYFNQSTGRPQWEAPSGSDGEGHGDRSIGGHNPGYGALGGAAAGAGAYGAYAAHGGHDSGHDTRGYGGHDSHGYGGGGYGHDSHGGHHDDKSDKKAMLLGAAGGLAVGAIAGAVVADALDDSDHEGAPAAYAPPPAGYDNTGYSEQPPAVLPAEDADGDSVSSSDREDVQEAREEYEEAVADANDSDASSSDHEAAEEAREEYQEEYEETYED